jgi:hypothetical protein
MLVDAQPLVMQIVTTQISRERFMFATYGLRTARVRRRMIDERVIPQFSSSDAHRVPCWVADPRREERLIVRSLLRLQVGLVASVSRWSMDRTSVSSAPVGLNRSPLGRLLASLWSSVNGSLKAGHGRRGVAGPLRLGGPCAQAEVLLDRLPDQPRGAADAGGLPRDISSADRALRCSGGLRRSLPRMEVNWLPRE